MGNERNLRITETNESQGHDLTNLGALQDSQLVRVQRNKGRRKGCEKPEHTWIDRRSTDALLVFERSDSRWDEVRVRGSSIVLALELRLLVSELLVVVAPEGRLL